MVSLIFAEWSEFCIFRLLEIGLEVLDVKFGVDFLLLIHFFCFVFLNSFCGLEAHQLVFWLVYFMRRFIVLLIFFFSESEEANGTVFWHVWIISSIEWYGRAVPLVWNVGNRAFWFSGGKFGHCLMHQNRINVVWPPCISNRSQFLPFHVFFSLFPLIENHLGVDPVLLGSDHRSLDYIALIVMGRHVRLDKG